VPVSINGKNIVRMTVKLSSIFLLILIIWGCGVVPHLHEGTEANYIRLPFVRILLENGEKEMTIGGGKSFSVECMRGDKSFVYYSSQPVTIRQNGGGLSVWMKNNKIDDNFNEVLIMPRYRDDLLEKSGSRYRGIFRVIPHGINLYLINIVHMDDYLKGVVPPELGKVGDAEFEAVKAQAVAARTYAMAHLLQYPDEPYDMKSDVSDQVYHGVKVEKSLVSRAIDETRGYVIKYKDDLINAYYHSTCGGSTDDIDEVWNKVRKPYLQAVTDSDYCSWSKYYNWKESYSAKQLKLRIEQYLSSERGRQVKIGRIQDIIIKSHTTGGRVAELTVKTDRGDYSFGKDRIRWVFTRSSNPELILQSAGFDIRTEKDKRGYLVRADFIGGGYGHGVGMCQCGALGMSRRGKTYEDILTHYYSNVKLAKLY